MLKRGIEKGVDSPFPQICHVRVLRKEQSGGGRFGAAETEDRMDSCAVVMPGHIAILLREIFKI